MILDKAATYRHRYTKDEFEAELKIEYGQIWVRGYSNYPDSTFNYDTLNFDSSALEIGM